jgi:NAD(P)H-hydrate epimerase
VQADLTVTFALPKPSLLLYPAAGWAGRVTVVDIGIPPALIREGAATLAVLEPTDVAPAFPVRDPAGHKGTYGHVLVVAGSAGKTGAAAMTAEAALRTGAGLVTLAVPGSVQDVLAAKLTEVMTEALPETEARTIGWESCDRLRQLAAGKSAVALGPGLGTHPATAKLVRELLATLALPVVADADALSALAGQARALRGAPGPRVLTPHPGEMARLLGVDRDVVLAERLQIVPRTARELEATVVLKTARTLIADASGPAWIVPTGNPGMATGGTGDVLTGIVAGLLSRGVEPTLAACAAAYVHGLAGDLAAARLGPEAMLAGDLLRHLPDAIRAVKDVERSAFSVERSTRNAARGT